MNVIDFLKINVEKYPKKNAIITENEIISYEKLWNDVKEISSIISKYENESIISLISENSISFIISYLAIIRSGKIVHIVSPDISEISLVKQIYSSGSNLIICSDKVFDKISKYSKVTIQILKFSEMKKDSNDKDFNRKENHISHLIYTSGTTSDPKGVAITHSMIEFTTKNIVKVFDYVNSDVDILPLPLHHSFGLGCFHTSMMVGSTLILHNDASDLEKLLESIKKFNATTMAVIPATLTKFLKFDKKKINDYFSDMRLIMTNSTRIPKNTIESFREILKNGHLATYYGLTEASRSTFMIFNEDISKDESVGKPAPGVNLKIDNDGNSEGEILIKGKNVISKYWNNNTADKNIAGGWLRTGDLGILDNENFLFLKGRKDETINVGGEKVFPNEIEEVVKQVSGVRDVVAFGIENEIFGQVVKLQVVKTSESDLSKSNILIHCIKNLEKYKIPSKIDFVDNIPKTSYGKVKRFMLK
ncbi:class I adenylate-forming enzyme family protein [Nitrosopumilus adriaticus]|uniref:class I adenylate-forming enzyme family protein n=1 Tax=Nitrosopumilus adriaticus TaxID=1580092 RepID=UPI00352C2A7D